MATKGAQSIQNTCTASNNVVDVSTHYEVVCKSDAQDRDVLDSFKVVQWVVVDLFVSRTSACRDCGKI